LGPRWYRQIRLYFLREQSPKLGMTPTKLMFRAVAVCAYTSPQSLHFRSKLLSREPFQILVHRSNLGIQASPKILDTVENIR